jgi:tetratricopeptide (TPR) repeat protein
MAYFLVTVSFYLKTYDSAQIKITLTQAGLSLVILFWLIQLVLEKRWPFERKDIWILAPFLAILLSGVVSYTQASLPLGSLEEFIRRVLYAFMAVIVIVEFRGWDRHRRLLRWLLAAFAVVVFYGLVQFFDTRLFPPGAGVGLDPFVWRQAFGQRIFSSFGNPNFYGNFLVIVTPILLGIYLRSGGHLLRPYLMLVALVPTVYLMDKLCLTTFGSLDVGDRLWVQLGLVLSVVALAALVWWKVPRVGASGMLLFFGGMFVTLYATETKGAWMGFLAALSTTTVLASLFLTRPEAQRTVRVVLLLMAVTAVLGLATVGYYARNRIQSVSFRVFTWISTWEMIREQPWLGTGIGSFKWIYPAYRRPEIILLEGKSNTETDHAEDEYLEIWFDEGAVGFGLFLWLVLTVSLLGVRALSRLARAPPTPNISDRLAERRHLLVVYLGSWWGALIHWFVDVSVRFVSSGIYSFLLPGLVASLVRNGRMPARQDALHPWDFRIRLGLTLFWGGFFLCLGIPAINVLAVTILLWLLGELLEFRLAENVTNPEPGSSFLRPGFLQLLVVVLLVGLWGWGFQKIHGYFEADLKHNMGIFFSRGQIWAKAPEFEGALTNLPLDIKKKYEELGGAIEHYEEVLRLNSAFPMARYFIGNVYSDWGSMFYGRAIEARNRGDVTGAEGFKKQAEQKWEKALQAYDKLKEFAPNYVQTHHQVGLVYLKQGDLELAWGNKEKNEAQWEKALHHFRIYQKLDPVFPPNYYQIAYIYYRQGNYEEAEKVYQGALRYNTKNVVNRISAERNVETYTHLGKLLYTKGPQGTLKSMTYFQSALTEAEKLSDADRRRWGLESAKALATIHAQLNNPAQANSYWERARAYNPQDPDVLRVFQGK